MGQADHHALQGLPALGLVDHFDRLPELRIPRS